MSLLETSKDYDFSISFTRVASTFFIVICHVASYFKLTPIALFFNVGVPLFFLISGYLYGNSTIKKPGIWLVRRYIRLEVPALLWLLLAFISAGIGNSDYPPYHSCVFLLMNLQGLRFIFPSMERLFLGPWFFTSIMCCYCLLLCWNQILKKHPSAERIFHFGGIIPLFIFVALSYLRVCTSGALVFFIGLTLKRRGLIEHQKRSHLLLAILLFILAVGLRLLTRQIADGTILYDLIIVPITHGVIAVAILLIVKWLFIYFPLQMNKISGCKIIKHIDKISVYIYISHTFLFDGMLLSVFTWHIPFVMQILVLFGLVILLGTVLWLIGEQITKKLECFVQFLFV